MSKAGNRRWLWLTPMALLLGGCASTSGPSPDLTDARLAAAPLAEAPDKAAVAVKAPQQLEGFTLISLDAAEEEATGTRMRYQSHAFADLILDGFAYFVGFTDQHDAVISDFESSFPQYMAEAVEQGYYRTYTPRRHGRLSVDFPFGSREGAWRLFTIANSDYELLSATYLFYRPPFGIKLRASHPPTITDEMLLRHIDHFALQFLPQLVVRRNRGCSQLDTDASLDERLHDAMMGCSDYDALVSRSAKPRRQADLATSAGGGR